MYIKLSILVLFLLLSGCEKVDKDELKALNNLQVEKNSTKTILKVEENLTKTVVKDNTTIVENRPILEENITLPTVVKTDFTTEQKYFISLEQIEKDIKLAQDSSNHQLAIATLASEKELQLNKNDAQSRVDLAKIELQKIQEKESSKQSLQYKMQEKELQKINNDQILAQELEQNRVLLKKEELEIYKIVVAIVGFLIIVILLIFYLLRKSAQDKKAKLAEEEQKQKMNFKIMKEQSKNLDKMLQVITQKDLSNNIEKEILNTIKESQKRTLIFEERPKKGLIFRR